MKISGIYIIWLLNNDDTPHGIYVGSSIDLNDRRCRHYYLLRHDRHHNIRLQRFYNKNGEMRVKFEIIEETAPDKHTLINREQYWIDCLTNELGWDYLYNIAKIVDRPTPQYGPQLEKRTFSYDDALELLKSGITVKEIAIVFGVSTGAISYALKNEPRYKQYVADQKKRCALIATNTPNRTVKLHKFDRNEALTLYKEGWSHRQIAKHFSVARSVVNAALNKLEDYDPRPAHRILSYPIDEVVHLRESGLSYEKIGKKYNVTGDAIGYALRAYYKEMVQSK